MPKVTRYLIRYTQNSGQRSSLSKEFKNKADAKKFIKKSLAPGKLNVPGDRRTRRTAPRQLVTNYGFNNPRIVKRELLR